MALTGKFLADFSDFYAACQEAEVSIKSIGESAALVGPKLNRMTEQFSGKKVISDAVAMTRAIEEIGGVSKLTESEMRRVGTTMETALFKMRAAGEPIPKNMQEIADATKGVEQPTQGWGSAISMVTTAVKGLVGLQLVRWLKDAAQAGIEWASAMSEMHAKTQIPTRDLQILEDLAIETGVSIEALTTAVQDMQAKIGSGEARKAIFDLNLNFDELRKLKPADQFAAIAGAIASIEDPAKRAAAAKEIFKNWKEILPGLRGDIAEIAKTTNFVAEESIKDLDRLSAKWNRFWNDFDKNSGAWAANVYRRFTDPLKQSAQDALAAQEGAARRRAEYVRQGILAPDLPTAPTVRDRGPTLPLADPSMISDLRLMGETLEQQTASVTRNEKAKKTLAETTKLLNSEVATASASYSEFSRIFSVDTLQSGMRQLAGDTTTATLSLVNFTGTLDDLTPVLTASTDFGKLVNFKGLGKAAKEATKFGDSITNYFEDDFGKTVVAAIAGGGNVAKAALTGLGNSIFAKDTALSKSISDGVTGLFGETGMMGKIGKTIAGAVPVIGSLIGPAIEGITKLFGKSEESAKVSPLRDAFFQLQGGLETLNPRVQALTGNLELVKAVMDAKTVDQYNAAMKGLTDVFAFQDQAMATLNETAKRYGFTLEELGPAMQRQELDKQAQQLFKDWEVLNSAGIDTVAITTRMAESVNAYVQQALAMGSEVPEAMRPMLQKMADMGQLTDASGNKVEDLEKSGISFAMTMSQGFQALISEVGKLTDAISRGLGLAVDSTTHKIKNVPHEIPVEVKYKDPGFKSTQEVEVRYNTSGAPKPQESYQEGTHGFRNFGSGTPVMLHGWEAVVPMEPPSTKGATLPLLGGPAAAVSEPPVIVNIDARGALFGGPGDEQRLASLVERALTAKYGLQHGIRAA